MVYIVRQVSDERLQRTGVLSGAQFFERVRCRDRLDHVPVSCSSAHVSFFACIADAAKRRLPCQLRDYRVELFGRAYHRQLDSVGCGHFEASVSLHSRYKGAGVHICMQVRKLVSKEEAGGG